RLLGNIGERAIAVVVVKRGPLALVSYLRAIRPHSLVLAMRPMLIRKFRVISNEQIQAAVAIVIEPRGARRPFARVFYSGLFRAIRESAVSVIVQQRARWIAR